MAKSKAAPAKDAPAFSEFIPMMALSKGSGGVFPMEFDDAGPETPRPTDADDTYLLLVAGKGDEARFAPSTYWFDGSVWRSQDQTSNDTVADETVVAWALLPRSVRVRLT